MASTFKIGDTVNSNHGVAKIKHIEVVEPGEKEDGISVKKFYWSMKNQVVVDLDNGHWAYGASLRIAHQPTEQYPARMNMAEALEAKCK
jgi:hypothetical protein